jgi:hypothetical protein
VVPPERRMIRTVTPESKPEVVSNLAALTHAVNRNELQLLEVGEVTLVVRMASEESPYTTIEFPGRNHSQFFDSRVYDSRGLLDGMMEAALAGEDPTTHHYTDYLNQQMVVGLIADMERNLLPRARDVLRLRDYLTGDADSFSPEYFPTIKAAGLINNSIDPNRSYVSGVLRDIVMSVMPEEEGRVRFRPDRLITRFHPSEMRPRVEL